MVKHSLISGWYVDLWFITHKDNSVTTHIRDFFSHEKVADCGLKFHTLLYCVTFLVGMIRTCLMEVPLSNLRSCSPAGFYNTLSLKALIDESTWNDFHSYTVLLKICLKGYFHVPYTKRPWKGGL